MALSQHDNANVAKILNICQLLDEDYKTRPETNRRMISTMYYLGSQYIKKAFGMKTKNLREGQENVFALSGFKKPLTALIEEYKNASDHETGEQIRLTLIFLSHFFDDRFFDITHHHFQESEVLDVEAKLEEFASGNLDDGHTFVDLN